MDWEPADIVDLDGPATGLIPVSGRVRSVILDRAGSGDVVGPGLPDDDPAPDFVSPAWLDIPAPCRRLIGAWAVALVAGFALTDGSWIFIVPALTFVSAVWADRRIQFSFAEGFIGYRGEFGWPLRVQEDDVVVGSWRSSALPKG